MASLYAQIRHKAVWGSRYAPGRRLVSLGFRTSAVALLSFVCALGLATDASAKGQHRSDRFPKMDRDLESRAVSADRTRKSRVIVRLKPGKTLPDALKPFSRFGRLNGIGGHVLDVTDDQLQGLANLADAVDIQPDRPVHGLDFRTDVTAGSFFVNHNIGLTGDGVTVAVLDSGVAANHDDLPGGTVVFFADFVNYRTKRYDDFGHGTHVAGIIAGKGTDSGGKTAGVAPGAKLVVLKVLDKDGNGTISNAIAALEWLATNGPALGVRVVNLSFGARPVEQPEDDPLALAAKALVDKGIVVVAAAGNNGQDGDRKIWGGIPSPADAPWVITVGASSTLGTLTRKDDKMAGFSSRGPAVGRIAKPDLVASGVGTVSTIASEAGMYNSQSQFLVKASCPLFTFCPTTLFTPYMSMSGTSMAAPVVTGTVALMLQADPNLTPNMVKAILQYTAEIHSGYSALEQGAGFLNALGAVELAQFYASGQPNSKAPVSPAWSTHIFWGNHRLTGGIMSPAANAWKTTTAWGSLRPAAADDNIVWGTALSDDNIVWGTAASDSDNIVWGTAAADADNIVWGTAFADDNIVWGTDCGGLNCGDNIVWGTDDGSDNIVWGTSDADNIVWGTADSEDNIVWGTGFDLPTLAVALPADPSFSWFKKARNSGPWILWEFGDASFLTVARPASTSASTGSTARVKHTPKSHGKKRR